MKETKNKFWNVKNDGNKSRIDLFGYVGGSKEWNYGFNEEDFLKEFRAIPEDNALEISINSFGGSVFTALSIYSLLKTHKGEVTIRIDGAAMSAATIISSVPNGKVIMPKGAIMMIHKVSSIADGNADDLREIADRLDKIEGNLLDIYAEKTGKSVEDIKPLVDAETYFTAQEAVDFGLADELDDTKTVENKMVGNAVMINGLEVSAKLFERAPKGFFNAGKTAKTNKNKTKEDKPMDLEKLKAEYPELVEAIRNEAKTEGVEQERARIKAIEDVAMPGFENLVEKAKFESGMTAENLAMEIVKAQKAKAKETMKKRVEDAADLNDVSNADDGIEGIVPPKDDKKKTRAEKLAEANAQFAAAKKA